MLQDIRQIAGLAGRGGSPQQECMHGIVTYVREFGRYLEVR